MIKTVNNKLSDVCRVQQSLYNRSVQFCVPYWSSLCVLYWPGFRIPCWPWFLCSILARILWSDRCCHHVQSLRVNLVVVISLKLYRKINKELLALVFFANSFADRYLVIFWIIFCTYFIEWNSVLKLFCVSRVSLFCVINQLNAVKSGNSVTLMERLFSL
jgi:hypothetical protein